MKPLIFNDNRHYIEDVPLDYIVNEYGTPIIVYSKKQILDNVNSFKNAFSLFQDHEFHYATKSNYNLHILNLIRNMEGGLDAANPNEAHLGIRVGFDKRKITVSPNNLSRSELNELVDEEFIINFDDEIQFSLVDSIPEVFSLRINPGIGKGEFRGITTGGKNSKFGTSPENALKTYEKAKNLGIRRFGIHMHTGSNVLDSDFFKYSSKAFFSIARKISDELNIDFEYLDVGGGYGVPYTPGQNDLDISKVAKNIYDSLKVPENRRLWGAKIITEPGRFMVANSAVILSSVTNVKRTDRNFIGTDLSFNVLLRPALYGAKHHFEIMNKLYGKQKRFIITGQACENTDRLGENVALVEPKIGDVLITYNGGAYVTSMSSNYNLLKRPMEIMVDGDQIDIIRKGDDLDYIIDRFLT